MNPASGKFLAAIQSKDVEVRYAAWNNADSADPEVIPALGKLLVAGEPGVRKAADESLKRMVHSVGKETGGTRRAAVIQQMIVLTGDGEADWTRTLALRHLSLIGGDETVPVAARLLRNSGLQEEAAFCLERIPGHAADQALIDALPDVSDAFKPRLLNALGHRRAEEAADICAGAMGTPDLDIAIAGMRATGRIGIKPGVEVKVPRFEMLSGWQKIDYTDSSLRYADEQARRGNHEEALKIYGDLLNRPEEHVQCAVVIGLSKMSSPDAAALIYTQLKSANRTVRITARKAWAAMAKS
jgi:HEAT repeat protein